jgi:hypothetical protein
MLSTKVHGFRLLHFRVTLLSLRGQSRSSFVRCTEIKIATGRVSPQNSEDGDSDVGDELDREIQSLSTDDIVTHTRLLENEIKIWGSCLRGVDSIAIYVIDTYAPGARSQ